MTPDTPAPVYRIRDWAELYESSDTKKIKGALRYVLLFNKQDGEGYRAIWEDPATAPAVFSGWILLLEVASKANCPALRGWLVRNDGRPHTSRSLHLKTGAPAELFDTAIARLLDTEVGWIEEAPQDEYLAALAAAGLPPPPPEKSGGPRKNPQTAPPSAEKTALKGREGKGTEETGRETGVAVIGLEGGCRGEAEARLLDPSQELAGWPAFQSAAAAAVGPERAGAAVALVCEVLMARGANLAEPDGAHVRALGWLEKAARKPPRDVMAWLRTRLEGNSDPPDDPDMKAAKERLRPYRERLIPGLRMVSLATEKMHAERRADAARRTRGSRFAYMREKVERLSPGKRARLLQAIDEAEMKANDRKEKQA